MGKMQITIPEPCHESWDKMTPAEKGKFCGSCQKVVIDFSRMSDAELVAYFKKPKDSVCGRFKEDQLNRVVAPPPKRLPWIRYFFQIALPAFLLSIKASSQQRQLGRVVAVKQDSIKRTDCVPDIDKALEGRVGGPVVMQAVEEELRTVRGKVVSETGDPIPYATVVIKGTKNGTACDTAGHFTLRYKGDKAILQVTALSYQPKEIAVTKNDQIDVVMTTLESLMLGEVIIVGRPRIKPKKEKAVVVEKPKSSDSKDIRLYPNPVSSGANVTLEWDKAIGGEYELQFVSEEGVVVQRTQLEILHKSVKTTIHLPELSYGPYVVLLINKKTKASYTTKLLIQ